MFNVSAFLSHIFLFEGLTTSELLSLSSFCIEVRLKKNQSLFSEGQFVDAFYVIAFGKMKVFRLTSQGEESILHIHDDGESIAEAAIFDDERYPANAVSVEETLLVKIPSVKF